MIGFKRHLDKYGDMYADWDPANRNEAQQILASITSFEFIVVFMAVYQYLSHLAGITVKLQRAALDIVEAHGMITEVASFYRKQREDCDKTFSAVYTQSVAMAEKVGTAAEMPRITSRQQHRSNTEAQNPKIYFQRNVAIPLLDHIIMCTNEQFSPSATVVLCSKNVNLEAAVNKYNDDLPSPEMFEMELMRWRGRYLAMEPELRPASPAVAIKDCDDDLFPNISILLKIACTIPVTSCECERSASTLRRLNNYMQASMGKERLSNLALLHIHYDTPVELDTVVNYYAHLHPRRLQLENLLQ
ncbi:52 kDa repressor of the inhibitor of the protein kinase-like [Oculina patagonica]